MGDTILRLQGIVKDFPGTRALDRVQLDLRSGEIHAVVGENGAGKSTLVRILAGVLSPDQGVLELDGRPLVLRGPADALRHGLATVYQEQYLVPELTVAQNLILGFEGRHSDGETLLGRGREVLRELGAEFGLEARLASLERPDRQLVQVARALILATRALVLDEPTEGLSLNHYARLRELLRGYRARGLAIVYISHRLKEVLALADRITVLRDGQRVETLPRGEADEAKLIYLMVGEMGRETATSNGRAPGRVRLRVMDLSGRGFRKVSLEIHTGEIVGLAGVPGSGKAELLRALAGAEPYTGGRVEIDGQACSPGSPQAAWQLGLALVPADRKADGLVLPAAVRTNIVLPAGSGTHHWGLRRRRSEAAAAQRMVSKLQIRTPSIEQPVETLSGGNQQKVLFARLVQAGARVALLDEPTQGVDVAGKVEIHALIRQMARDGAAVLLASSEMEELLGLADRIVVLRQGALVAEFDRGAATAEEVLRLSLPQD